jgi:hypothetical protein
MVFASSMRYRIPAAVPAMGLAALSFVICHLSFVRRVCGGVRGATAAGPEPARIKDAPPQPDTNDK